MVILQSLGGDCVSYKPSVVNAQVLKAGKCMQSSKMTWLNCNMMVVHTTCTLNETYVILTF